MRIDGRSETLSLVDVYAPIAADLQHAQQILADELICDQGAISDLCRHVGRFHGKLLRPALVLLAGRACGGVRGEHHVLAAVVELVHLATLVHDDVLDEADIRRRVGTVNRLWGTEQAVLMGDLLYSHAYHLCSGLASPYPARLIGKTAITVCEGEMMQVAHRGDYSLPEPTYFDIISRKTAALVETCCHLGAWASGADAEAARALCEYGRSVGVSFQIIDDLLDLVGDEAEVGKSLGRDLCEGELTLPLIHYLSKAPPAARDKLAAWLRSGDSSRRREIVGLLEATGSLDYAEQIARQRIAAAREALAALPPTAARDNLDELATFVLARRQ